MPHKDIKPTAEHMEIKKDIAEILRKYEHLGTLELLAIASQIVGIIIAQQDQNEVTPTSALRTVAENIQLGNQAAIDPLSRPEGRA